MPCCVCVIAGNYAYVGFLILENTYNNAVVHTFIRLMVDASREKKKCGDHVWGVPFDQDNTDEEQLESGKFLFSSLLANVWLWSQLCYFISQSAYTTTS